MKNQNELETRLQKNLDALKEIPARDPRIAVQRRAQFLKQAVSASEVQRHKKWMFTFRKEQFAMNLLISTLVVAGLLFGGGTAVYAAQDDLPNEPLYAVKMWSEVTQLQFQGGQQEKADLLMAMAETRIAEIAELTADGQPVPEEVQLLLQQHIQQALQLCTDSEDVTCDEILLQIRDRLQAQDQLMQQLLLAAPEESQLTLLQTRDMLHTQLQLLDDGLLFGEMNQNEIQVQQQNGQNEEFTPPAQTETGAQFNQPTEAPGIGTGNINGTSGSGNSNGNSSGGGNSNGNGSGGNGNKP